MTVRQRLWALGVLSILVVLGSAGWLVADKVRARRDDRRRDTQHVVEVATGVVKRFGALEQAGTLSREAAQEGARLAIKDLRYGGTEYFWVHDLSGQMIMHPAKPELDGKPVGDLQDPNGVYLFREMNAVVRQGGAGFVSYAWPKPGFEAPVDKISYVAGYAPWGWVVGSGVYLDDVHAELVTDLTRLGAGVLLLSVVLALVIARVVRSIVSPLQASVAIADRIASGDLSRAVPPSVARDELGALVNALGRMQLQLRATVGGIHRATGFIGTAVEQLGQGSHDIEARTRDQVVRLEETASTIEELTATVRQNAQTATQVEAAAHQASGLAADGGRSVGAVGAAMALLTTTATRIGEISTVVDDIAFQTNLLALNASVEASRAGEHGRGFAVVAAEVRSLSMRSADSAREIGALISQAQEEIAQGAAAALDAGRIVAQVVEASTGLARTVEDISRASREQSSALEQASRSVSEIDTATQRNMVVIQQAAQTADGLGGEARTLSRAVAGFVLGGSAAA